MNQSHKQLSNFQTLTVESSLDDRIFLVSSIRQVWVRRHYILFAIMSLITLVLIGGLIGFIFIYPDAKNAIYKGISKGIFTESKYFIYSICSGWAFLILVMIVVSGKLLLFTQKLAKSKQYAVFCLERLTCNYNFPLKDGRIRGIQVDQTVINPITWSSVERNEIKMSWLKPLFGDISSAKIDNNSQYFRVFFTIPDEDDFLAGIPGLPYWGKGKLPILEGVLSSPEEKAKLDNFIKTCNQAIAAMTSRIDKNIA